MKKLADHLWARAGVPVFALVACCFQAVNDPAKESKGAFARIKQYDLEVSRL